MDTGHSQQTIEAGVQDQLAHLSKEVATLQQQCEELLATNKHLSHSYEHLYQNLANSYSSVQSLAGTVQQLQPSIQQLLHITNSLLSTRLSAQQQQLGAQAQQLCSRILSLLNSAQDTATADSQQNYKPAAIKSTTPVLNTTEEEQAALSSSWILIVDDEPVIRCLLEQTIKGYGFKATAVDNGQAALEFLQNDQLPDLVLLDVVMPKMNGFAVCTALRSRSETKHIPIVMLTSLKDDDSIQHAYQAGATDFLTKPINFSMLRHRLNYILRATRTANKLRASEQQVRQMAFIDNVTGLPNRALLSNRLEQALAQAKANQNLAAVLFLDLDHFKRVNDTLGHAAGDELLRKVARRLKACVRSSDTVLQEFIHEQDTDHPKPAQNLVARLGGDEFVVILNEIQQPEDVAIVAQRMNTALAKPIQIKGRQVQIGCSIGMSIYPIDGNNSTELLKNADAAMYHAKHQGRNRFEFYGESLNQRSQQRDSLEQRLQQALEQEQFVLHYQPRITLATGQVSGVEVLLRWLQQDNHLILPKTFFELTEESNLPISIGSWVFQTACQQAQTWQDKKLSLAINLSTTQFKCSTLKDIIASALAKTKLAPEQLEVEITEQTLLQDNELTAQRLKQLKQLGIQIAVDNFGSDHTSLHTLQQWPIDIVKLSGALLPTLDKPKSTSAAAMLSTVIDFSHKLDKTVIATGVEKQNQLELLQSCSCDEAQGYLFSKPLSAENCVKYLTPAKRSALLIQPYESARI